MEMRIGRRELAAGLAALPLIGQMSGGASAQTATDGTPTGGTPEPVRVPATERDPGVGPLRVVAQLTGPDSINDTFARYGVYGTDLGHTFLYHDALYMVFGDTFAQNQTDWRSNVLAVISDGDPSDGLSFDRMIEDVPGHAKELIAQEAVPGTEVTIIPTYGVAVGDRMILHYMAVSYWGLPGQWDLSQAGLASSDDGGENWTVDPNAVWPAETNFGQVAFVPQDGTIYAFGIPGGRFGGVKLGRVAEAELQNLAAWEYWDGTGWVAGDETVGTEILSAPVGELSVRWNSYYGKWLMMYLNENRYAIVLRTADELMGPWTDEQVVVTGQEYAALYGPFMLPRWNDGPELYFTMSQFGPYEVYLMQTTLPGLAPAAGTPVATPVAIIP